MGLRKIHILACCFVFAVSGGLRAAEGSDEFKDPEANAAVRAETVTEAKVREEYQKAVTAAKKKLVQQLTAAQDIATKAGNLDEAVKIRDAIAVQIAELQAAGAPADKPSEPARSNGQVVVLTGAQKEDALALDPSQRYRLEKEFNVPKDKSLTIPAGITILCDKDSELSVNGSLEVQGTAEKPVIMEAPRRAFGVWKGIAAREAQKVDMAYLQVFDAKTALLSQKSKLTLKGCVLAGNGTGLYLGDYGTASKAALEHCVIAANDNEGIDMMGSEAVLDHCTIVGNGGWAIRGAYYTSPQIRDSVIVGNRGGGIWIKNYECKPTMNGSVIYNNAKADIVCEVSFDWDFTKNYWGKRVTGVLQANGDGVALPTITDGKVKQGVGKVRLQDFLKAPPEDVGASIKQIREKNISWGE